MVRFAGRIADWKDDKGFGFVTPNGGGERAFVHIKAFQRGSRRPRDGDLVSYRVTSAGGRATACEIRHAGRRIEVRRQPARMPRAALGIMSLATIGGVVLLGVLPSILGGWYAAASLASYLAYLFDKTSAERGGRRTPESTLHLFDLLGGWPGALIAQQQLRHKTVKQPYQFVFWLTVVGNLGAVWWWLDSSGTMIHP